MSTVKEIPSFSAGSIARSTSVLTSGTLLSRILGFVRDILFARFFGTGVGADAFVTAFRLPNLFRDIMGEGAANSAFVPVMMQYKHKQSGEVGEFLGACFFWALVILSGITAAGMLFAPQLIRCIAPGFADTPGKFELTVMLTRIMFPYLILIGLTALLSAVQFTYGAFFAPALGPALMNVVLIFSIFVSIVFFSDNPVYGMAFGVLAGGLVQYLFQQAALRRVGLWIVPPRQMFNEGASRVGRLIVPRIAGSAVYQLNVFVDTVCASLGSVVGLGGIAAIYYATRLVQLPMGLFAVALSTASLPSLSAHAAAGRKEEFDKTLVFALRNIVFVMLPASIFLVCFAVSVVRVLFERGAFDAHSTYQTASALLFYSLALTGYGASRILASAFHALQDTRTPVIVALICLGVNAVLDVVLMFPLGLSGLALASAFSSVVNVFLLRKFLRARLLTPVLVSAAFFVRVLLCSAVAAVVACAGMAFFSSLPEVAGLVFSVCLFVVAYFLCARAMGFEQAGQMLKLFRR
jgi:putative peptidoglycan lipid II flippase